MVKKIKADIIHTPVRNANREKNPFLIPAALKSRNDNIVEITSVIKKGMLISSLKAPLKTDSGISPLCLKKKYTPIKKLITKNRTERFIKVQI